MSQENNIVTEFIHLISGLNGSLVRSGDELMQDYGLTNARWRVMQSIQLNGVQTVARMARSIGLKRQGVQRIVNELEQEGFVRLIDNPDHKRARLVEPTAAGAAALEAVSRRYDDWAGALENRFSKDRLDRLTRELITMRELVIGNGTEAKADAPAETVNAEETESEKSAQHHPVRVRLPETPLWP